MTAKFRPISTPPPTKLPSRITPTDATSASGSPMPCNPAIRNSTESATECSNPRNANTKTTVTMITHLVKSLVSLPL